MYSITDAGRAELRDREGELGGIEDEVTDSVRRLADEVRSSVDAAMKSLRADLAAAARDARQDARDSARTVRADTTGPRSESSGNLQEAEILLQTFRHQIRSELRERLGSGELAAETIAVLRSGLEDVRAAIAESLRKTRD